MATRMERLREFVTTLAEEAREELAIYEHILQGSGAAKSTKRTRASKPCCTKEEVIQVLVGLLRDNGALSRDELEELAKHKLSRERGRNLSGFAMRFREALGDGPFHEARDNVFELRSTGAALGDEADTEDGS